jgi:hypothetical protein
MQRYTRGCTAPYDPGVGRAIGAAYVESTTNVEDNANVDGKSVSRTDDVVSQHNAFEAPPLCETETDNVTDKIIALPLHKTETDTVTGTSLRHATSQGHHDTQVSVRLPTIDEGEEMDQCTAQNINKYAQYTPSTIGDDGAGTHLLNDAWVPTDGRPLQPRTVDRRIFTWDVNAPPSFINTVMTGVAMAYSDTLGEVLLMLPEAHYTQETPTSLLSELQCGAHGIAIDSVPKAFGGGGAIHLPGSDDATVDFRLLHGAMTLPTRRVTREELNDPKIPRFVLSSENRPWNEMRLNEEPTDGSRMIWDAIAPTETWNTAHVRSALSTVNETTDDVTTCDVINTDDKAYWVRLASASSHNSHTLTDDVNALYGEDDGTISFDDRDDDDESTYWSKIIGIVNDHTVAKTLAAIEDCTQ